MEHFTNSLIFPITGLFVWLTSFDISKPKICLNFRFYLKDAEETMLGQMWPLMMSLYTEDPVQVFPPI